jgi:hypothetical protein
MVAGLASTTFAQKHADLPARVLKVADTGNNGTIDLAGTEFEVKPKRTPPPGYRRHLVRISALPSRDCEGAVTKINCSALHRSGDNCFPSNHLSLSELANSRHFDCGF